MRLGSLLAGAGLVHAAVNARLLRRPVVLGPHARTGHRVSVLIPARDESSTIGECLDRLSGQDIGEILVLDDGSSDDTAARAAAAGARVVAGTPPPIGWLGKPHACAQLAAAADAGSDVFVFLDADVRLAPGAVAAAVALLDALDLDLVSPNPRQLAGSASERLIQPLLEWSILTFLPVRVAERSSRPSLGVANGQFVVVRRAAYVRAGGHVPDEILDDLALAHGGQEQRWPRGGRRRFATGDLPDVRRLARVA